MEIMDNPLIEAGLINSIKHQLIKRHQTLAVAESVTSGLIQAAISQAIDASQFYQGGITVYNLGQKYKHLNIEPIHALECDCISEKVAGEMALNCCALFKSDWGLGITGYASVVPEKANSLMAYYAIAFNQKVVLKGRIDAEEAEPYRVQLLYMRSLVNTLEEYLRNYKSEL